MKVKANKDVDVLVGSKYVRLRKNQSYNVVKVQQYKIMIQVGKNVYSWVLRKDFDVE